MDGLSQLVRLLLFGVLVGAALWFFFGEDPDRPLPAFVAFVGSACLLALAGWV